MGATRLRLQKERGDQSDAQQGGKVKKNDVLVRRLLEALDLPHDPGGLRPLGKVDELLVSSRQVVGVAVLDEGEVRQVDTWEKRG